jgi:hypothetical protein
MTQMCLTKESLLKGNDLYSLPPTLFRSAAFILKQYFSFLPNCLIEEVNRIEPSPSVRVPWSDIYNSVSFSQAQGWYNQNYLRTTNDRHLCKHGLPLEWSGCFIGVRTLSLTTLKLMTLILTIREWDIHQNESMLVPSVIMLSVKMKSIMQSVVMLNVVAPV